jgi:hypothetical protein
MSTTDKSKIPPERRGVVIPHLIVSNAKEALDLYKRPLEQKCCE